MPTGSDVHCFLSGTVGTCKCAWSLDTAGVPSLSLGKQPGAGGANWIQLFPGHDVYFQTLQKLGATRDKRTLGKVGPNEAAGADFRM